jgi:hypothetical protein
MLLQGDLLREIPRHSVPVAHDMRDLTPEQVKRHAFPAQGGHQEYEQEGRHRNLV